MHASCCCYCYIRDRPLPISLARPFPCRCMYSKQTDRVASANVPSPSPRPPTYSTYLPRRPDSRKEEGADARQTPLEINLNVTPKSSPCTQHTTHNTRKEEGRAESKKTEQRRELTAPVIQNHALSSATVLLSGREGQLPADITASPATGIHVSCYTPHLHTHTYTHARQQAGIKGQGPGTD